jgi:type III restriction enzyme
MFELREYQRKAVSELLQSFSVMLAREETKKICVFQAPTGSGKTLMTAIFISELIKENPSEDLCFLWVSIGKGELHLQSKKALDKVFRGFPEVNLLDTEFHGGRKTINRNEVVVVNWEKLRTKERSTDEWKNLLMRDGEVVNFREILSNTRSERKIVLIIDESHYGASAERTTELRDEIDANIVLEMSATPKFEPKNRDIQIGLAGFVYVEPQVVIQEGMIKKEIIINDSLQKIVDDEIDSQEIVLRAAFAKREEIKKGYDELGININPLVLIQIPNSEAGEIKAQAVIDFLYQKGVTEQRDGTGNGKLAIYLNDRPVSDNYKWIANPNSEIEFLIFKQAIDTGWDCPRAHILVKFRETRSETFEIQTVGRILRMPEQKHYLNETLNTGFIFTNIQSILVKKEEYNPNIIKHLKSHTDISIWEHGLVGYYKSRADYGDIGSSFLPVFERIANTYFGIKDDTHFEDNIKKVEAKKINMDIDKFQQSIISDLGLNSMKFDELSGDLLSDHFIRLTISGNDLLVLFENHLREHAGHFRSIKRSIPTMKSALYVWFRKYLGSKNWNDPSLIVQKIIVHESNRAIFGEIMDLAIAEYAEIRKEEVLEKITAGEQFYDYDLPKELFHNQHTEVVLPKKKYAFDYCYLDISRSNPEQQFEELIDQMVDVKWWWKNGENRKEYFSVKYEYPEGTPRAFFPDYILKLRDETLMIVEMKSASDFDGLTTTPLKMRALNDYLENSKKVKNVTCGIVVAKGKQLLAHKGDDYDWNKTTINDWSEWIPVEKFIDV